MKKLTEKQRQLELARIAAIPDDEIDTSDIPELTPRENEGKPRSAVRGWLLIRAPALRANPD